MSKFEYCTYTTEDIKNVIKSTLSYATGKDIDVTNKTTNEVIAELGHSGWEMVSVTQNNNKRCMYFKRVVD